MTVRSMTVGQKASLSLLCAVIVFAVFAVAAFSGLFDLVESRFYNPTVARGYEKTLASAAAASDAYHSALLGSFTSKSLLNSDAIKRSFLPNISAEDAFNRSNAVGKLQEETPGLMGIRFIDSAGKRIHFSTFSQDVQKQSATETIYRNYGDVGDIPYETIFSPALAEGREESKASDGRIILDSQASRFIYSLPFYDSFKVYRGSALFYVSQGGLVASLLRAGLISVGDDAILAGDRGVILKAPLVGREALAARVAELWQAGLSEGPLPLTEGDAASSLVLFSKATADAGNIGVVIPSSSFVFPVSMKWLLLGSFFMTAYLLAFLILNLRQDRMTVLSDRIKRFQINLLEGYLSNKADIDFERWSRELEARRSEVKEEFKHGIGMKRKGKDSAVDELIDKSWDEILAILGKKAAAEALPSAVSVREVQALIAEAFKSGSFVLPPQLVEVSAPTTRPHHPEPRPAPRQVAPAASDEIEELEEAEPVEEAGEAGQVEEIEAAEAVEELEEVEELEASGPEEAEGIPASRTSPPAETRPADTRVSKAEVEEAEAEEIEELEEMEEFEEAEEIGDLEEPAEAVAEEKRIEPAPTIPTAALLSPTQAPAEAAAELEELEELEGFEELEEVDEIEASPSLSPAPPAAQPEAAVPVAFESPSAGAKAGVTEKLEELEELEELESPEEVEETEVEAAPFMPGPSASPAQALGFSSLQAPDEEIGELEELDSGSHGDEGFDRFFSESKPAFGDMRAAAAQALALASDTDDIPLIPEASGLELADEADISDIIGFIEVDEEGGEAAAVEDIDFLSPTDAMPALEESPEDLEEIQEPVLQGAAIFPVEEAGEIGDLEPYESFEPIEPVLETEPRHALSISLGSLDLSSLVGGEEGPAGAEEMDATRSDYKAPSPVESVAAAPTATVAALSPEVPPVEELSLVSQEQIEILESLPLFGAPGGKEELPGEASDVEPVGGAFSTYFPPERYAGSAAFNSALILGELPVCEDGEGDEADALLPDDGFDYPESQEPEADEADGPIVYRDGLYQVEEEFGGHPVELNPALKELADSVLSSTPSGLAASDGQDSAPSSP